MTGSAAPPVRRSSTVFLQVVIVLVGIGALALMLWEPHIEGRNARATVFQVYFNDPFLACAYIASIAFFVALYQAFRVLGYAGQGRVFTLEAVRAFRIVKYCAITLIGFIAVAQFYFFVFVRGRDDIAGGVAVGLIMACACVVVAVAAAVFERLLRSAVEIQAENDLTV